MQRISIMKSMVIAVSILGLMASACVAGTVFIPVSGEDQVTLVDPGIQWTDDDGITHMRGLLYSSEVTGQDIDGTPVAGTGLYELSVNINLVTGDGNVHATGTSTQQYGELSGGWRSNFTAAITGFVYDGRVVSPQGSGDFAGWHFRGTWTGIFGGGVTYFDCVFQIPGGGNKAMAGEAATWSSVRALYR